MTEREDGLAVAGAKLREWRENAGISQEAAAHRIQSTQATWGGWERGERTPDVVFAFAIEKLTGGAVMAESWAVARPASRIARGIGADDADKTGPRQVPADDELRRAAGS